MDEMTTKQLPEERDGRPRRKQGLLQSGTLLQNRYRIIDTLGVGGFSSVYQARDMHFPSVTRLCAVKEMIHANRNAQARIIATQSFEREASILATLDHPAVPDVYDYFSEEDRSSLVLEYIHGQDLEALLNDEDSYFPGDVVLEWAIQLCNVLHYLHNHRPKPVIFRDIKPSNIMLDRHGRIRLIDFNIAKLFHTGLKGTMIGTEGYSPPEQYRGEATPPGDIYALGATLHHILTRQDPRTEPPFSFHDRPIREVNPSVPQVFEELVMRCLSYELVERYQTAAALREALFKIAPNLSPVMLTYDDFRSSVKRKIRPTFDGEIIGVATTSGKDRQTTTPLWLFRCEDEIRAAVSVDHDIVYVGSYDHNLYALTAEKGDFVWKYPSKDGIASSPFVYGDSVLTGSADGNLYSLHRSSGRLQWCAETGGPIYSSPRADFDHVFIGSDDGYLYAVNMANGRTVWRAEAHGQVRSTPRIGNDSVYFGTEAGYVYCVDLSGKVKWQFQAKRAVTSSPLLVEDMVIFGSLDSTVYAIDSNSGWAIWRHRTHRPIVSSPVVSQEKVLIGSSDCNLYALDIYSGRDIWQFKTEGQISSSPAVWDNAVYFGATDGAIYSLDIKRGKLRWRFQTNAMVIASPVIEEGTVYIGSCDHNVYALSP
jgi:serine/threonine protein kinase